MKIITFFSEKGGVGKTTFSSMFASWLAYAKKEKVYVFDFDFPGYQMTNMRNRDLGTFEKGDNQLAQLASGNDFFQIAQIPGDYKGYKDAHLQDIAEKISGMKKLDGYAVMDFPGRFLKCDPAYYLIKVGLIDLIVFPITTDIQSISSALNLTNIIRNPKSIPGGKDQSILYMWNMETANERKGKKDWYATYDHLFESMNIPVASFRMRDIEILRRDPPTFGFVRNTLCWPEVNVKMRCPYVEDLFSEIKQTLDETGDKK
ncbi:MAG: ParA family protein [Bacteroidales bacterium]|nr:ParA family protein [Bacteroidales bacterium]